MSKLHPLLRKRKQCYSSIFVLPPSRLQTTWVCALLTPPYTSLTSHRATIFTCILFAIPSFLVLGLRERERALDLSGQQICIYAQLIHPPSTTSLCHLVASARLAVPPKSQIWFLLMFHVSSHISPPQGNFPSPHV